MTGTISVTWITGDGEITAAVPVGLTLMEAALHNGVAGILGECGGVLACATCRVVVVHCPVPLGEADGFEREMLEFAAAPVAGSERLSCQIQAGPELDGIVLGVPR